MDAEEQEVVWTEVAAFYLTCYMRQSSFGHPEREFNRLRHLDEEQLVRLLEGETHRGARVPRYLGRKNRYVWRHAEVPLAELHMGPGAPWTDYSDVVQRIGSKNHVSVGGFCEWLNSQSLAGILKMDSSITSFIPEGQVPHFFKRVIVAEVDEKHSDIRNRLLDGYHRSVVLYLLGESNVRAYLGRR